MYVQILNYDGTRVLNEIRDFEGLKTETVMPGGFSVASFTAKRPVKQYWSDLIPYNIVKIGESDLSVWEGYIDQPVKTLAPDKIDVQCLGWSSRLKDMGTEVDINVGPGLYDVSFFINTVIGADTDCGLTIGSVETTGTDYAFPNGHVFTFAPYTSYQDALDQMNQPNNWDYAVWENRALSWNPPSPTVDWHVLTSDCTDLSITPNTEAFCNYVVVYYTPDGSTYLSEVRQDTASQDNYGRVVKRKLDVPGWCFAAQTAKDIGDAYLAETSTLKVQAEFTTQRVYDIRGAEHHLSEVRAGDVVRLPDWLPTEEVLGSISNIGTFPIKSTDYQDDSYSLRVTPTSFVPQVEILFARLSIQGALLE